MVINLKMLNHNWLDCLFNIDSKKIDSILIVEKKLLQISFLTKVVKNIYLILMLDLYC